MDDKVTGKTSDPTEGDSAETTEVAEATEANISAKPIENLEQSSGTPLPAAEEATAEEATAEIPPPRQPSLEETEPSYSQSFSPKLEQKLLNEIIPETARKVEHQKDDSMLDKENIPPSPITEVEPQKADPVLDKENNPQSFVLNIPTTGEIDEISFLEEQFSQYMRIAKAFRSTLLRPTDKQICDNLIARLDRLNMSKNVTGKRNTNSFFRVSLKVLKWTSLNQPIDQYKSWYHDQQQLSPAEDSDYHTWLEKDKSYFAMTSLADDTLIIYAATTTDPSAGWNPNGFKILDQRGACERL